MKFHPFALLIHRYCRINNRPIQVRSSSSAKPTKVPALTAGYPPPSFAQAGGKVGSTISRPSAFLCVLCELERGAKATNGREASLFLRHRSEDTATTYCCHSGCDIKNHGTVFSVKDTFLSNSMMLFVDIFCTIFMKARQLFHRR